MPHELLQPGRLLRANQIVGHILPICRSQFWAQVQAGAIPRPIKLSPRVSCWRAEDIAAYIDNKTTK